MSLLLKWKPTRLPLPRKFSCSMPVARVRPLPLLKPAPMEKLPARRSVTVTFRSTWSAVPGTRSCSISADSMYSSRCRRRRERSSSGGDSQPPSICRSSRRSTSSWVEMLPTISMRRTYTRWPGSMKKLIATSPCSSSSSVIGLTLAKA